MKVIRKKDSPLSHDASTAVPESAIPWKVLIVDDEPDVHAVTRLAFTDVSFDNKPIKLLEALSAAEAKEILRDNKDIALAFIDVVMETDDAGLLLVDWIRKKHNNHFIRLVIRTGQAGLAPERYVIEKYDIDDYKDKTELTTQKLYTTLRTSLKAYRDFTNLENNRLGLKTILDSTPTFYRSKSIENFFYKVIAQILGMFGKDYNTFNSYEHCFIATVENDVAVLQCGYGRFSDYKQLSDTQKTLAASCLQLLKNHSLQSDIIPGQCFPMINNGLLLAFIYVESESNSYDEYASSLLQLLAHQSASALGNLRLVRDLKNSNRQAHIMLAKASEYKDKDTGNHLNRIARYTSALAKQLGLSTETAKSYARASMMHDIGKIGVPDSIIRKPGKLTREEFQLIKTHSEIGARILKTHGWFNTACDIARYHHEKWDGSGYPEGLKAEDIPLPARIVAVADVFDALISTRPYKDPWPIEDAMNEIVKGKGAAFDPDIVDCFLELYNRRTIQKIVSNFAEEAEHPVSDVYKDLYSSTANSS